MEAGGDLQGLRVLVAEDEVLVAMLIEEMCADLGCQVVGPYATLPEALEGSRGSDFDVALVDMNLAGLMADPVLAELRDRSIPFAIASGAGQAGAQLGGALVVDKPFTFARFAECLTALAAQSRTGDASGSPS